MIAGFTGTSAKSLTSAQVSTLVRFILHARPAEFHHGDCIRADQEAHALVRLHLPGCRIIIHPPADPKARAFCAGDVVLPERPYLKRNQDIVNACTHLIAAPMGSEALRSGTWATVRAARRAGRPIMMLWP